MKDSGNFQENSGECSRRCRKMLLNILGNVIKDIHGMCKKILENVTKDSGKCY